MDKPSPQAVAAFEAALPADPRVERRKMFGCDAAFVGGHLFLAVFEDGVTLRLGEAGSAAAVQQPGVAPFEPVPGRPWKAYVVANGARYRDSEQLVDWALAAFDHAVALPPKPRRQPSQKGKSS